MAKSLEEQRSHDAQQPASALPYGDFDHAWRQQLRHRPTLIQDLLSTRGSNKGR